MDENATGSRCVACLSPINTGATKCPRCQSDQKPNWKGSLKDYSAILGLLVALIAVLTFALSGAPTLYSTLTRNKAIVKAEFAGSSSSPDGASVTRVLFVNYGLRSAAISKNMTCFSLTKTGEIVKDKSGQSFPELLVTSDEGRIEGETTRIVTFDSHGGLPVPKEELDNLEVGGIECSVWFADIATDVDREGIKKTFLKIRTMFQ